jgi:hypothetical protein
MACNGCGAPVAKVNNRAGFELCTECGATALNFKMTAYSAKMLVRLLQGEVGLEIIEFREGLLDGIRKSNPELVDEGDGEH